MYVWETYAAHAWGKEGGAPRLGIGGITLPGTQRSSPAALLPSILGIMLVLVRRSPHILSLDGLAAHSFQLCVSVTGLMCF